MNKNNNKVFINGRFLTQELSGMQRYAQELVAHLDQLLPTADPAAQLQVELVVPRKPAKRALPLQRIRMVEVGNTTSHVWEQTDFAWHARNGIAVNLMAGGPLLHPRSVVALHDAAIFVHPENFSANYRRFHTFLRPRLAKAAARLITISEFSRHELARHCGVPPEAFTIIGDSAEHILHASADTGILQRHGIHPGRYVLTVGNQAPNKNIALAANAFMDAAPAEWQMVLAGGGSEKVFGAATQVASDRVKRVGRVTDGELRALYENAGLFVFPSRYEGFGVPPLEAMLLGCPVLASDAASIPEILGDAAHYFATDSAPDIRRQLKSVLENYAYRISLAAKGPEQAKKFNWKRHAEKLFSVITSF